MIDYDKLGRAAFDNDAQAAEIPFPEICTRLGVDPHDLRRAAEQRALRCVIQQRGPEEAKRLSLQAYAGTFSAEDMSDEEKTQLVLFAAVWMDGAMAALRAKKDDNDGTT